MKERVWDVVVIGAGPGGASAAYAAATGGARTLLLDKARFPRSKVCGGCLNAPGVGSLRQHGLLDDRPDWADSTYSNLLLGCRGRSADIAVAPGIVVERSEFDQWLVDRAQDAGVLFRDSTGARVAPMIGDGPRSIQISHAEKQWMVTASVVVVASGLASKDKAMPAWRVARGSKIGLHAIVPGVVAPGTIEMAVGRDGYVGAAQLTDNRLDIAGAVRPESLRAAGSAGALLSSIRAEAGFSPREELHAARFTGTPRLTRRRTRVAGHRMMLVGDAAGYVEPFTGEGIAWALASGFSAGRLAARACARWAVSFEKEWATTHRHLIGRRQRACRIVRAVLSRPRLVSAGVALAAADTEFASVVGSFASRPYLAGACR